MQAAFFRACGLSSRGDAVPPGYVSGSGETGNDTPPLVRTADEAAPPRREQRNKSPAELDFYGEFYAALCGAPVLPVLPKAKCGRRKRAKRAKGTPLACLLFDSFRTSVFCEVRTQLVGKTKFFDCLKEKRDIRPRICTAPSRFLAINKNGGRE